MLVIYKPDDTRNYVAKKEQKVKLLETPADKPKRKKKFTKKNKIYLTSLVNKA
jgi:hypothetical protein